MLKVGLECQADISPPPQPPKKDKKGDRETLGLFFD